MAQPSPKSRCMLLLIFIKAVLIFITAPFISWSSTANGMVTYVKNLHRGDTVVWVWMLYYHKEQFFATDILQEPLDM